LQKFLFHTFFSCAGEGHPGSEEWTFGKLREEVGAWAKALKALGVKRGDVVAGVLPNCPQVINLNLPKLDPMAT